MNDGVMFHVINLILKNCGFEVNQSATEWNIGTILIVGGFGLHGWERLRSEETESQNLLYSWCKSRRFIVLPDLIPQNKARWCVL